jgi:hypothetical protein
VLLATRAALDGDDVVTALEEQDADRVLERLRAVGADALVRTRQWFTSFGCCAVKDPLHDLQGMGILLD